MADLLNEDLIAYDPLSDVTRKERRALLGTSVLGVALVKVPLVPEKISTFGVDFSPPNQRTFLAIYALVVLYFLAAFAIYAFTDVVAWRRARIRRHQEYSRQRVASDVALGEAGVNMLAEARERAARISGDDEALTYRGLASYRVAELASLLRALFEFGVPTVFSIYAVAVLFKGA
jgi:hypothetical protein